MVDALKCLYLANQTVCPVMKKALLFAILVIGFSSCSKDSLESETEQFFSIAKSEMAVMVTYLTWSDQACDLGCTGSGTETVSAVANAKVDLYLGDITGTDQPGASLQVGVTDRNGSVLFEDLDPGQYTLIVDTPFGQKSKTIFTQLHRRASVEFSF